MPKKYPKSKISFQNRSCIFAKCPDIAITLNYSLIGASALGVQGSNTLLFGV